MGIPTVTFVTEPFESAARTHADIHGMPEWRKHMTLRLAEDIRVELADAPRALTS